ncbi:MAG: rhamnan synthesis F family protein [Oscillospiraceae bacterium]|nr:rhamnan synthesis F family protein [Oscillospiraceae bacterium]
MSKKRLAIFLFYDKDGIADRYVEYLLSSIRPCMERLIVIVNGEANEEAVKMFESIADTVVIRENNGFDVAAWRHGIVDICEKAELEKYDSLTLLNDSFFGPFYPFEEIYSEMENRNKDYWGLSAHGEIEGAGLCPYGYRPAYIQTYFMVFEKSLLVSDDFFFFWDKLPNYDVFIELAEKFVAVLTKHFSDLGYSWDVLCNTSDLDGARSENYDQHTYNIYELIAHRHYPIIKRHSFYAPKDNYLQHSNGCDLPRSLEFIEKNYDYDLTMIFEHLLRLYKVNDLKKSLCLDYVVEDYPHYEVPTKGKAAVFAYLVCKNMFEKYQTYLKNIPENIDIVIMTDSEENVQKLNNICNNIPDRNFSVLKSNHCAGGSSIVFWVECKDIIMKYKYLCFIHDTENPHNDFPTVHAEYERMNWENMLHSSAYITNIIGLLSEHEYLGILSPFGANHGHYFSMSADYWCGYYDSAVKLADRIGIKSPNKLDSPLSFNNCFWCKASALKKLVESDLTYEDFMSETGEIDNNICHGAERIPMYVAADGGYASGWVYSTEYAGAELSSLRFMMDSLVGELGKVSMVKTNDFCSFYASVKRFIKARGKDNANNKSKELKKLDTMKQKIKRITPKSILSIYCRIRYR